MQDDFIDILSRKLRQPLPGFDAQLKMAHVTRRLYKSPPAAAKQAGVLATLFLKKNEWHVVLIERNANDKDHHGGQISFSGGKFEPADASMLNTALRETEEEIGIPRKDVHVLGGLTDMYIPVSNFQVHPFVGYLDDEPSYRLQQEEVNAVLEVPLAHFQKSNAVKTTNIRIGQHIILNKVPYFDVEGKILWGATAMMLNELMEVIGRQ